MHTTNIGTTDSTHTTTINQLSSERHELGRQQNIQRLQREQAERNDNNINQLIITDTAVSHNTSSSSLTNTHNRLNNNNSNNNNTNTTTTTTSHRLSRSLQYPDLQCSWCRLSIRLLMQKSISPRLCRCANCKAVYYCSKQCQENDWKMHRTLCRQIKLIDKKGIKYVKLASNIQLYKPNVDISINHNVFDLYGHDHRIQVTNNLFNNLLKHCIDNNKYNMDKLNIVHRILCGTIKHIEHLTINNNNNTLAINSFNNSLVQNQQPYIQQFQPQSFNPQQSSQSHETEYTATPYHQDYVHNSSMLSTFNDMNLQQQQSMQYNAESILSNTQQCHYHECDYVNSINTAQYISNTQLKQSLNNLLCTIIQTCNQHIRDIISLYIHNITHIFNHELSQLSKPQPNYYVKFHYLAKLSNGQVFDSSRRDRSYLPYSSILGHSCLIEGLEYALYSMYQNEKATFLINANSAYGDNGANIKIPPKCPLIYEIHCITFYSIFDKLTGKLIKEARLLKLNLSNENNHLIEYSDTDDDDTYVLRDDVTLEDEYIECSNQCDQSIQRKDLDDHLLHECRLRSIICGKCNTSMIQQDYTKHIDNELQCETMMQSTKDHVISDDDSNFDNNDKISNDVECIALQSVNLYDIDLPSIDDRDLPDGNSTDHADSCLLNDTSNSASDWAKIYEHTNKAKSIVQTRSHAQQYFVESIKYGKQHQILPAKKCDNNENTEASNNNNNDNQK